MAPQREQRRWRIKAAVLVLGALCVAFRRPLLFLAIGHPSDASLERQFRASPVQFERLLTIIREEHFNPADRTEQRVSEPRRAEFEDLLHELDLRAAFVNQDGTVDLRAGVFGFPGSHVAKGFAFSEEPERQTSTFSGNVKLQK